MTKISLTKKTFKEWYNELNDMKKAKLRISYLEDHAYANDTFYKKLNGETMFRPNEQKWICDHLQITPEEIVFPTRN